MDTENISLEAHRQDVTPPLPPQRGWWSRNWLWFVPTTLVVMMLLCCGCVTGVIFFVASQLRLEPFPKALKLVQEDPRVIEKLGTPIIYASIIPSGERNVKDGRGEARMNFDVAGPKGKAHVHLQARCIDSKWGFTQLEVEFNSNDRINLRVDSGDDAPAFHGTKSTPKKSNVNTPAPEINLPTPPNDMPEGPK
jgi:hypothetical protein